MMQQPQSNFPLLAEKSFVTIKKLTDTQMSYFSEMWGICSLNVTYSENRVSKADLNFLQFGEGRMAALFMCCDGGTKKHIPKTNASG